MILKVAGMGVGYVFMLAVTRTEGTAAWGVFSLCLTVLTLASIVGRLGVDTAMLRYVAAARGTGASERGAEVMVVGLVVVAIASIAAMAVVHILAEAIAADIFRKPNLVTAIRISAIGIPALAVGLASSQCLRGLNRIRQFVFFDLVGRMMVPLLLLPVIWLVMPVGNKALMAYVIGGYILLAANLYVLKKAVKSQRPVRTLIRSGFSSNLHLQLLSIGRPLLLASSILYLKGWIDTLMLGVYGTESAIGVYNIAIKLATLCTLPLMAVNAVAAPKFAEAFARQEPARLKTVVERSGRMILVTSLPIAVVLCIGAKPILSLFGSEATSAVVPLIILTIAYLVNAMTGSVGPILNMTGGQIAFRNISAAVLLVKVALNFVLMPQYGITGAALSTLIGVLLWNGACAIHIHRTMQISTIPFLSINTTNASSGS